MTRRAYLYFVLTFLLGIVIGAWGVFSYGWYSGHWRRSFSKARVIEHMKHDLNLSDTQVRVIEGIIEDSSKKYEALDSQIEPQFAAIREERRNRIRQVLTPEQLVKFNEMVGRSNEKMRRHPPH